MVPQRYDAGLMTETLRLGREWLQVTSKNPLRRVTSREFKIESLIAQQMLKQDLHDPKDLTKFDLEKPFVLNLEDLPVHLRMKRFMRIPLGPVIVTSRLVATIKLENNSNAPNEDRKSLWRRIYTVPYDQAEWPTVSRVCLTGDSFDKTDNGKRTISRSISVGLGRNGVTPLELAALHQLFATATPVSRVKS